MRHKVITSVSEGVEKAIEVINGGGVVIMPADTVYGLFAKATNKFAVDRVYEIKKREKRKPFVIYTNKHKVDSVCEVNQSARRLIDNVWPQALALILPKKHIIADWFTDNRETVAVMTARNPLISQVTQGVSDPIFGTTVNISGEPELKTGESVMPFAGQVDLLVDKDDLIVYNKPSTMIDCTISPPKVIRLSALSHEYLQQIEPALDMDLSRRAS